MLSLCDRLDRHAVLLFFDLNDFKSINDRFGHAEGDHALKAFADTLTARCATATWSHGLAATSSSCC